MIVRSAYPDPVVPDVSLKEFLFGGLDAADGNHTAVLDAATGRGYTYAELVTAVDPIRACTHGIPHDRPDIDVGSIGVLMAAATPERG